MFLFIFLLVVPVSLSEILLNQESPCLGSGEKPCVRKCCKKDEFISTGVKCTSSPSQQTFLQLQSYKGRTIEGNISDFHIIYDEGCKAGESSVILGSETEQLYVQGDGNLLVLPGDMYLSVNEYCLDMFQESGYEEGTLGAIWCIPTDQLEELDDKQSLILYSIGMIISVPFLLMTFIAYALYPDKNLHMMALMCYVITLMLGYLIFIIIQLTKSQFEPTTCAIMGYGGLFFFICSFFWMNVICVDIWFTFSGFRGYIGNKNSERKRFYLYMLYAFGMSILHVILVFTIDKTTDQSSWFNPGIGTGQCFLKGGHAELLYFYGPVALLLTTNIIFYSITALKIRVIKRDTSMLRREDSQRHSSQENDEQKFNLYLKLLFGMGVNWSMEVVSWAVNWAYGEIPKPVWYLTDFCNAIYGVFIFFIFVFRRNVWKLLRKRYYNFIGRPYLGQTMTGTMSPPSTTTYSLSMSTPTAEENLYSPPPTKK